MQILKAALLVVLILSAGCGSGGLGQPPPPPFDFVAFVRGDPNVSFYDNWLAFEEALGAPADGRIDRLNPSDGTELAEAQELYFKFLVFFLLTFDLPVPGLLLDLLCLLDSSLDDEYPILTDRLGRRLTLQIPVAQDENGDFAAGKNTLYHVGRDTADVHAVLVSPRRFGRVESGLSVELRGAFNGAGWGFDVVVDQEDGSPVSFERIRARVGSVVEDLGSLDEGTAQTLTTSLSMDDLILNLPLIVEFEAYQNGFWEDLRVIFDLDVSPPPPTMTDPREHLIGLANEGVAMFSRELYGLLFPNEVSLERDDLVLMLVGEQNWMVGRSTPTGYENVASGPPLTPGARIYRGNLFGQRPPPLEFLTAPGAAPRQTSPTAGARVLVGSEGLSIANFDDTLKAFEADSIVDVGNMTDVSPFDGDPFSGEAVYVDNSADAIKFITRDALNQYVLDPAATIPNTAWPGASGRVVSAFRHTSGDLLFVTDGEPGELWVVPAGAASATKIGDVAAAPRSVRAAGNIAAVGSYGSPVGMGGLGLFVRSAAGTWGPAPFSRSGARAVGIDVKQLSDGRIAVASTSFLGDSLLLTVLDNTTGEILDAQDIPLPLSCTGPGHCAFVPEPGLEAVGVSCNTSNSVVLIPVSYAP